LAVGVETGNHVQIGLESLWNGLGVFFSGCFVKLAEQFEDAVCGLTASFRIVTVKPIKASPGMGVNNGDAALFLLQVLQSDNQGKVLDDIGVVAGVESVSVTEHARMVTPQHPNSLKNLAKPNLTGIKSRASQRISDPAAKGL
jgi:hypothetical protein